MRISRNRRHAAPRGKASAEKWPHGNRTWPRKAAEKTTFRARANYASRGITVQKALAKNTGTSEDVPLKRVRALANVRSARN